MIKSQITHGRTIVTYKPLQKSLPYREKVMYRGPVLQRGYGLRSIFKSVARSVMPSLKEIGKSALTTGFEVLQDVAKGENIKTAAKKRLQEKSLAFLDDTASRMAPRKSIKGSTNKQIAISSPKPKKRKHQSGELDDTIFFKVKERKKLKMAKPVHKDSNDCSSSSLDLFLLPRAQSSFQKGKSIDYHPITSLSDDGPIEFKVSGSGKEFLDLARSYLYLKVKVSKANDSN